MDEEELLWVTQTVPKGLKQETCSLFIANNGLAFVMQLKTAHRTLTA